MAVRSKITINQTLHGYRAGHKMLSSSIVLSDSDKRLMLALSDYSGSGMESGFMEYLTGYPLASSNYYVFAKTWYADEMNRPGCVWTHSLLIDFTDLWSITDFETLEDFFRRPEHSEQGDRYSDEIEIVSSQQIRSRPRSEALLRLSSELYNSKDESVVLLAKSSESYKSIIFDLWCLQWPRLKRSFKFSTGSLNFRFYESSAFDLQVMPYARERSVKFNDKVPLRIVDLSEKTSKKTGEIGSTNYSVESLLDFMVKFGSDVSGYRSNYLSLYRGFNLLSKRPTSIEPIIEYLKANFSDPNEAKLLKAEIIERYLNSTGFDKAELLNFLLTANSLSNVQWTFSKIILSLWNTRDISDEDLVNILDHMLKSEIYGDHVTHLLSTLPMSVWINAHLTTSHYLDIFSANPKMIGEPMFWRLKSDIQDRIFQALNEVENISWQPVIFAMLSVNSDRYANNISKSRKERTVEDLVTWIVLNDRPLPSRWEEILIKYSKQFFTNIASRANLSPEIFATANKVLVVDSKFWADLPTETIIGLSSRFYDQTYEPEVTGFCTLILNIAFEDRFKDSSLVTQNYFQDTHDRMMKHVYHRNSWERFKWCMGGNLFRIIENNYDSKHFQDRINIPEWDRCEFLRRALLVCFLRYKWDPIVLIRTVRDKETFQYILDFAFQLNEGKKFMKALFKKMELQTLDSTFHFKLLKKAL